MELYCHATLEDISMSQLNTDICNGQYKVLNTVSSHLKEEKDGDHLVVKTEYDPSLVKTEVIEFNSGYYNYCNHDITSTSQNDIAMSDSKPDSCKYPTEICTVEIDVKKEKDIDQIILQNEQDDTFIKTEFMSVADSDLSKGGKKYSCLETIVQPEVGESSQVYERDNLSNDQGTASSVVASNSIGKAKKTGASNKEKTLLCGFCPYKTFHNTHLKRHILIHTREKPFSCQHCDYKTNYSTTLRMHNNDHMGAKLFSCDVCSYRTNYSAHLRRHILTHTGEKPYICHICPFKTSDPSTLKRHIYDHSGDKPFACEYCPYKTNNARSLRGHSYIHTGEKPFACEICPLKTANKSTLRRHLREVHGQR